MRTARLLTISQYALPGITCLGVYLWGDTCQGVHLPGVYLPGVYLPGGVPARVGMYLPMGYLPGGTCPWGVPAQGGVPSRESVPTQVLPTVNRMTDRCKNITLPQTSFVGSKK